MKSDKLNLILTHAQRKIRNNLKKRQKDLIADMMKLDVCEWRITLHDWTGTYYKNCTDRISIPEIDPQKNDFKYCPYCGKPIRVIEEEKDG